MYYAHSTKNPDKSDWQYLHDHLTNVGQLSRTFASDFSAGDLAYASGLLHDLGKYSQDFQRRLEGQNIHVDHSTAGAIEATRLFRDDQCAAGLMFAYLAAGHHGGLLNFGSAESGLCERLHKKKSRTILRTAQTFRLIRRQSGLSDCAPPRIKPVSPSHSSRGCSIRALLMRTLLIQKISALLKNLRYAGSTNRSGS